ncbi:unnamed protein product [Rhizoctonia solani]|uniref:Uncharacterized protein n=1 Tax=Rhizoctonia solani TaxID=456999 RepID=A0A8H2WBW4_9AGAM|nr:unnamed protein product [Rhizoctonia solani]
MGIHDLVEGGFRGMIKSSGHVKHFRHQCTTLVKICRHFWSFVAMMEGSQYQSFQKFVAIADLALQAVASKGKDIKNEDLQLKLDEAIIELVKYWQDLSTLGEHKYDPETLMLEARKTDEKRQRQIASVDELKKIPMLKTKVSFYIHEGSKQPLLLPLKVSESSTNEELLFKLGRNPASRIGLHENAFFYTQIVWEGDKTTAKNLGLTIGKGSEYTSKEGLSDLNSYFKGKILQGPIHVFVDRNPCIHILLTTKDWSRLFSLVRLIDSNKVIVLKGEFASPPPLGQLDELRSKRTGVDGTLYHAQQVVDKFIEPNARIDQYNVFWLDQKANQKVRKDANIQAPKSNCIGALCEARKFIIGQGGSRSDTIKQPKPKWLIEIPSKALNTNPSFNGWGPKPRIQRPAFPLSSSNSGGVTTSSTQTTSRGLGTRTEPDSATNRVKMMVERMENERKEAEKKEKEKREKEKKGIFGRIFGGSGKK